MHYLYRNYFAMQKSNRSITIWLFTGCFLVIAMVVIGGITRLTHSGLSMVDWKLFMGSVPPLSEQEWIETFEQYKQYPEFQLKNSHFTLEEFKSIFFWEYLHRLIGRLIGLAFIIPFIWFWIKKRLNPQLVKHLLIIFVMGAFQGFLGWFMVKSGLVKDPNVSHYRLAAHLVTALVLFGYILWVIYHLNTRSNPSQGFGAGKLKKMIVIMLILIIAQITYGAFVAGLKAGKDPSTFPMMQGGIIDERIPESFSKTGVISIIDNNYTVQFIHRYLAKIIFVYLFFIWFKSRKYDLSLHQRKGINLLVLSTFVQFLLGVVTLVYAVPVSLGVIHQFGAILVIAALLYLLYSLRKRNVSYASVI